MRRTAILVATLVLMALLLPSCGRSNPPGSDDDRTYTIATIVKLDGIAWFDRMREGVKKFGEDTGHKCFLLGPPQADAALQVQIIEDVIAQGVDAICVVPFSVEAIEPVLRKARSRGIIVAAGNYLDRRQRAVRQLRLRGPPDGLPRPVHGPEGSVRRLRREPDVEVTQ